MKKIIIISLAAIMFSGYALAAFKHKDVSLPENGGYFPSSVSGTLDQGYGLKSAGSLKVSLSCDGKKKAKDIVLHYSKGSKELYLIEAKTDVNGLLHKYTTKTYTFENRGASTRHITLTGYECK